MHDEEDEDKPTVVLDFNSLKEDLKQAEELTQSKLDIQFNVDFDDVEPLEEKAEPSIHQKNIYLFEYKSNYFKKVLPHYLNNPSLHLIEELNELNEALTNDPDSIIVFYYNSQPKAVNQLSRQIKKKFQKARTLIIAKNLSPEKAEQHANSKYGAHAYLNHPFDLNQFYQAVNTIEFKA